MRVAIDEHVEWLGQIAGLRQHVYQHESHAVGRLVAHRSFLQPADDPHAREQPYAVPFVVAEAAHEGTIELAQRRGRERRNQVAGEQHHFALAAIELCDRQPQVVQVIVNVGKDSYAACVCTRSYSQVLCSNAAFVIHDSVDRIEFARSFDDSNYLTDARFFPGTRKFIRGFDVRHDINGQCDVDILLRDLIHEPKFWMPGIIERSMGRHRGYVR